VRSLGARRSLRRLCGPAVWLSDLLLRSRIARCEPDPIRAAGLRGAIARPRKPSPAPGRGSPTSVACARFSPGVSAARVAPLRHPGSGRSAFHPPQLSPRVVSGLSDLAPTSAGALGGRRLRGVQLGVMSEEPLLVEGKPSWRPEVSLQALVSGNSVDQGR